MSTAAGPGNMAQFLHGCTRLSKAVGAVLTAGYLLQLVYAPTRQYLSLVAGRTFPCVWNVVTAGMLETRLLTLAISVLSVLVLSGAIEPVYGSREYLKLIVICSTSSGLGGLVVVYLAYALDRNKDANLLYTEISGFHGVISGLLVAIKQISPDTEIKLLQVVKFRAKHLAAFYILACLVGSIILGSVVKTLPFVVSGAYGAWFYLRFFQPSPSDGAQQGDASPDFSFASFFPPQVQPAVDKVATIACRLFRLQRGAPCRVVAAVPSAKSAEGSRRRERGARALEERLGLKSTVEVDRETTKQPKDIETGHGGNGLPLEQQQEQHSKAKHAVVAEPAAPSVEVPRPQS